MSCEYIIYRDWPHGGFYAADISDGNGRRRCKFQSLARTASDMRVIMARLYGPGATVVHEDVSQD